MLFPWIVILEVAYISRQEQGKHEANRRVALLKQLLVEWGWEMDEPSLLTAARFKADYHLSLADAVIAAWACTRGAILVHKDPEYTALSGEVKLEALPF